MISNVENIDCIEGMKQFPDNYFELAICDPPYGLERFKKGGSHINKYGSHLGNWNNTKPNNDYFQELFRVSKNQIIWGANNFDLPKSEYFIVWQKSNAEDFSFAMCEMAWTNCKIPAKIFKHFHVQTSDKNKIHPTQKPIELYTWQLENYAKQGDKILDTHLGSQSSRIAAYKKGFDFWGFEIDKDYFEQGNERFEKSIAMPLFDAPKELSCSQLTFA